MKILEFIGMALLAIGGLVCLIFLAAKNFNLQVLLPAGVIAVIGYLIICFTEQKEMKAADKKYNKWKENIIRNGIQIEVDLDKCEIKSNTYREEIIKDGGSFMSEYRALDTLIGKDTREYNSVNQSMIIYKADVLGNTRTFYSQMIPKDKASLTFILANQKKTKIYADRLKRKSYYFDLDFLKNK